MVWFTFYDDEITLFYWRGLDLFFQIKNKIIRTACILLIRLGGATLIVSGIRVCINLNKDLLIVTLLTIFLCWLRYKAGKTFGNIFK